MSRCRFRGNLYHVCRTTDGRTPEHGEVCRTEALAQVVSTATCVRGCHGPNHVLPCPVAQAIQDAQHDAR